jgi:Undecaprenyl-phosphate galactose phosphotransferase WbaP
MPTAPADSAGSTATAVREWQLKQLFDIVVASTLLILVAPLLVLIGLVIMATDGGPALFRQTRVGHNGRTFGCLKFRSMVMDSETALKAHLARDPKARREWEANQKLSRDPRVTPFGNFLRKSSLDELPQLINVLRGEMSLVGPRPIVPGEVRRYRANIREYMAVKPGLTGLWQVSGRSTCSYEERVALDVQYAREWSFVLDLVILIRTVPAVLLQKGSC